MDAHDLNIQYTKRAIKITYISDNTYFGIITNLYITKLFGWGKLFLRLGSGFNKPT